jgi:KEOPS complex subunit Pcc1
MNWKSSAEIQIKLKTERQAESIYKALKPESKKSFATRSEVEILMREREILLIIKAKDIVALRAALNSYLRFIKAMKKLINTIEKENFE